MKTADTKNLKSLVQNTKEVLLELSQMEMLSHFTFVGGSALAMYLNHRLSEDLDFFTWGNELQTEKIINEIKKLPFKNLQIQNSSLKQLDIIINQTKVTFFANNWDKLKTNAPFLNTISIASIELLTAMKINTLFLRAKYRDYYDLYVINKKVYSIKEMFSIGQQYIPEINQKLFQMALTFTNDITEDHIKHLKPEYKITTQAISKHFENEIKKGLKTK